MLTNEITFLIKQHIIKNASSRIREQEVGLKRKAGLWLGGSVGWSMVLYTRLQVRFPVMAPM